MRQVRAWPALLGLELLFVWPLAIRADRVDLRALRGSGDLLVLLTLWALLRWRGARWYWHAALAAVSAVLVLYQLDAALCRVLMRHEPVLYDQLFLLRHLRILLVDLWGLWSIAAAAAVLVVLSLGGLLVRRLLVPLRALLTPAQLTRTLRAFAIAWLVTLLASLPAVGAVQWRALELAHELVASYHLSRTIEAGLRASSYRGYAALALARKPRVLLFFVESYGRVMATDPVLQPTWQRTLDPLEAELARDGWHFVSAYSRAPTSGGRSWLAHASVLTGLRIGYQALFQRLHANGRVAVPNLVEFFRDHGYRTVLLGPADRARAGLRRNSPYPYTSTLGFDELGYAGPYFGWGRVPDQYSLGYAHARLLHTDTSPLFLMCTLVSSHAPWLQVPALVDDYRDMHAYAAPSGPASLPEARQLPERGTLGSQLERYSHQLRSAANAAWRPELRTGYARSIAYDFELLRRELLTLHGDELVIVMGDHQPPLVTPEGEDTAVPVHVLARDASLLAEYQAHGFVPRLRLAANAPAALAHAALFSLVVRGLVRADAPQAPLPPFLPDGVTVVEP